MKDAEPPGEPLPDIPARIWGIAAVTGAGAFMAMLDSTVANLAIEPIRAAFGSTLPLMQWIATAYLIALAVSLPAASWLGNRLGYGRVWTGSLMIFTVASALCALAPEPWMLIGARFVQGLAAGLMIPMGQAVIGAVAGPKQLGRLMGALGLVISLGPAVGPAFGGVVLDVSSWRWLFWINVPIGLAALVAARGLVPSGVKDHERPLDRLGLLLLGLGLPLLLYGTAEVGSEEATPTTVVALVAGGVMVSWFAFVARPTKYPLIDLSLFRRGTFAAATATAGLTGANMNGGLLLLPLYLLLIVGMDASQAGLMLLAMGLGSAAALYTGGKMTDRLGAGPVAITGSILLVLTTIPFLLPGVLSTIALAAVFVARGVGIALAQMPAMTAAYASVTTEEVGDASTLVNIAQRIGGAIGAIVVVVVLAQAGGGSDRASHAWAFTVLAVVSIATVVSAVTLQHLDRRSSQKAVAS